MSNAAFKNALKNSTNLKEFLNVCNQYYDTEGTRLGTITKGILINKIDEFINFTKAKPKK